MSEAPVSEPISDDAVLFQSIVHRISESGYAVVPGFFSRSDVDALREEGLALWEEGEFRKAAVGRGAETERRPEIRTDFIHWFDPAVLTTAQTLYWERMEKLRCELNRSLLLGLFELEAHFARFTPGGFYKAHLDRHQTNAARVLSAVTYLDEDWSSEDGGILRLFTDRELGTEGPSIEIVPEAGKLVLFLSADFWHEVRPALRPRHSIAGWFRQREAPVAAVFSE